MSIYLGNPGDGKLPGNHPLPGNAIRTNIFTLFETGDKQRE